MRCRVAKNIKKNSREIIIIEDCHASFPSRKLKHFVSLKGVTSSSRILMITRARQEYQNKIDPLRHRHHFYSHLTFSFHNFTATFCVLLSEQKSTKIANTLRNYISRCK